MFLDDSQNPANCQISVQVATPALNLSVRFPIPDLRSDQERGPWFKKSLQKEILHLAFTDLEFKTEFIGGSTPEQIKLELTFRELAGKIARSCEGADCRRTTAAKASRMKKYMTAANIQLITLC